MVLWTQKLSWRGRWHRPPRNDFHIVGGAKAFETEAPTETYIGGDPDGSLEARASILERQIEVPVIVPSYLQLYRYASKWDKAIVTLSSICAIAGGAALPLMTIIVGNLVDNLWNRSNGTVNLSEFKHDLNHNVIYFIYLAIAEFVLVYISTVGFIYTGEHITDRLRCAYLKALLRQNIAFFDKNGTGDISTCITGDMTAIQDGISHKVALTLAAIATFWTAFIIAFVKFWKLTLICSSSVVAIMLAIGIGSKFMLYYNQQAIDAYAEGGALAEEVLSSIKIVKAFGMQRRLAGLYDKSLKEVQRVGFRQKAVLATMIGCVMFIVFLNYGLAFWMGARFLVKGDVSVSDILTIVLSILVGAISLGQIGPNAQAFTASKAAAQKIYSTIDRGLLINSADLSGIVSLSEIVGDIEFKHVTHVYPSRPEVTVLENLNLSLAAGKTTAIVGASGSGKSTIIGLLERFYEPVSGSISIGGYDSQELRLSWLRQQMSLLPQESVLFPDTIFNNIVIGLVGSQFENIVEEERYNRVLDSAKKANAHDFISLLPDGYYTTVRNSLLSGGQKQRIAVARAIIKDPKILLLDEPTSALDGESERIVQEALDKISRERTTLLISHRMSAIANADFIVMMGGRGILDQGPQADMFERHPELLAKTRVELRQAGDESFSADLADMSPMAHNDFEEAISSLDNEKMHLLPFTVEGKLKHISSVEQDTGKSQYSLWTLIKFVASFNKQDLSFMSIGIFFAILAGGAQPTQGVFFAKTAVALSRPTSIPSDRHKIRSDTDFWASLYLMLGIVQLLTMTVQGVLLAVCSERLIHRARYAVFAALLRQCPTYFETLTYTSTGPTSLLNTEVPHLSALSGATLGVLLTATTTILAALIVSIAIGWKLALAIASTIPVILGCGYLRFWALARVAHVSAAAREKATSYAIEAIDAVRTVASLCMETSVAKEHERRLQIARRQSFRANLKSSALYAASQSLVFLCIALGFWYGGTLVGEGKYSLFQFYVCFAEVIFSVQSAGAFFTFAGDMGKAKNAAAEIKRLCDQVPEIDDAEEESDASTPEHRMAKIQAIEFRNVHFSYPSRPEAPVLQGFNLTIHGGQHIALVGASGSGKSTIVSLLERFYEVSSTPPMSFSSNSSAISSGIYINGTNIRDLPLADCRKSLSLVAQDPTLYRGTIRSNIQLGDPHDLATDDEIQRACQAVNIWDFVVSLPEGLSTDIGSKAVLLSGGQKQRFTIARALLRNPQVLLLDEAMAALDKESAASVQAALDKWAEGDKDRISITVAHQLRSINRKGMMIYVLDNGRVVESGLCDLIKRKGAFWKLFKRQAGYLEIGEQ